MCADPRCLFCASIIRALRAIDGLSLLTHRQPERCDVRPVRTAQTPGPVHAPGVAPAATGVGASKRRSTADAS